MAKGTVGLGGFAIDFRGCKITMESLMGTRPVAPSEMTKKIWAYVRREGLVDMNPARRTSRRPGASRGTQMSTRRGGLLVVPRQERTFKAALTRILQHGESSTVEFKEALRWDHHRPDAETTPSIAEAVAIKTIAGFLNSGRGGTLVIGIADDQRTVGLDRDYLTRARPSGRQQSDRDWFQLHLRSLVAAKIGPHISNQCIDTAIVAHEGKDVCVVRVSPSPSPVYVDGKTRAFYLRVGAATQELNVEQTVAFYRKRWPREP